MTAQSVYCNLGANILYLVHCILVSLLTVKTLVALVDDARFLRTVLYYHPTLLIIIVYL